MRVIWCLLLVTAAADGLSAVTRAREAAVRGDVPLAMVTLEEARSERLALAPAWSAILAALGRSRSAALLFFCELMYHDGIALKELEPETRALVEDLLPPEIFAAGSLLSRLAEDPRFQKRLLPPDETRCDGAKLWISCGKVRAVDCEDAATAREALREARSRGEPVVLRNAVVPPRWTRETLASLPFAVCRVAPTDAVSFVRESHPRVRDGEVAPPSVTVALSGGDAARRLDGEDEVVYVQTLAPRRLVDQVDLGFLDGAPIARLWASRSGVYSPLHYDAQDSHLVQVVGRKRVVLWPPHALPHLRPFPDDHPLARRCQVDVLDRPNARQTVLDSESAAVVATVARDAILGPGDAIWFPSHWAHHTVALSDDRHPEDPLLSISLSLREQDGRVVGA
ncbi:hypothetical protein CTAYLR_001434 [Chrysophaeum taylorii]|uniref:JmjC domain-containing protein n=1 Tax=Chrysophaeum taylorii TaxID=2483200 RepID=A0AAD7XIC0_9STRA|nr:hypothetical protein CTAYLR_001434 [Chrysophaeum taylorii]